MCQCLCKYVFALMYMHGKQRRHYREHRGKAITQRAPCCCQSLSDTSRQTVISFFPQHTSGDRTATVAACKTSPPALEFSRMNLSFFFSLISQVDLQLSQQRAKRNDIKIKFLYPTLTVDLAGVMTEYSCWFFGVVLRFV